MIFKYEFCKVTRNHVALSPASKAHSISVLALISLMRDEPCPLVLRYGFLHHLPRTLKYNHGNGNAYIVADKFDNKFRLCYKHLLKERPERSTDWEQIIQLKPFKN